MRDAGDQFLSAYVPIVETILMSLPLHVIWGYNESTAPGSREAELLEYLKACDWAGDRE